MTLDTGDELEMDFLRWAGRPGGVWLVQLPRLWMEEGWWWWGVWSCRWMAHRTATDCFRAFLSASFQTDDD